MIFAFAGIELIGTAAGECKDPAKMMPKAINSVIWRIGLFYVGSVVLLVLLLPWNAYQAGQSPFVTFFSKLGVPYIGTIMNIVVLTAALSSLNSGLYSTGRILRSLAMGGSAPKLMAKMSSQQVPYAGILVTCGIYVIGVVLNYLVPSQVFEIVLNIASLGIIASWAFIIVCQMRLRKAVRRRPRAAGIVQNAGRAVHLLADAGVPADRGGDDGVRLPERHLDHRHHSGAGGAADAGLVRPAQARAGSEAGQQATKSRTRTESTNRPPGRFFIRYKRP